MTMPRSVACPLMARKERMCDWLVLGWRVSDANFEFLQLRMLIPFRLKINLINLHVIRMFEFILEYCFATYLIIHINQCFLL